MLRSEIEAIRKGGADRALHEAFRARMWDIRSIADKLCGYDRTGFEEKVVEIRNNLSDAEQLFQELQ